MSSAPGGAWMPLGAQWACWIFFDHLHYFPDFSASCEAIFKILDATCRKIEALSLFGALIDQTSTANAIQAPPGADDIICTYFI